jgi:nucleotide-binding universal stress UspA family protein
MFRNILVAADASAHADEALAQAVDLAESERARLTLMTAVARPPATAYWGWAAPLAVQLADEARTHAASVLATARDRVPDDLPVTTILAPAPIHTALIEAGDGQSTARR